MQAATERQEFGKKKTTTTGFKMIARRELNGRNCLQNKNYEGGLVQSSQAVFFLARIVERWEGKNGKRERVG